MYGEGANVIQDDISGNDGISKKKEHAKFKPYTSESIRYTTSKDGNIIYAMQMVWNEKGICLARKLGTKAGLLKRQIKNISLLGLSEQVDWQITDDGLRMQTRNQKTNEYVYVWKIELQ